MQTELELLAPARNLEIGIAAIDCGADSVYIGGPALGARKEACNSFEDIATLCHYGAPFGVGVYLTLNTLLKDSELHKAEEYLWRAYEAGCKAVIVQDLRILKLNRPPLPLFASTQTDIRSVERARQLEELGFERLILPRELSLEQIRKMREAVGCDLESFVHGALCVCYSGRCYLSAYLTGRSANRGECAQPCRSNYTLVDEKGNILIKDKPLLSLKDLNLSLRLGDLVASGITSFKIEGRLKNASYVKNIVGYYSGLLNDFIATAGASAGATAGIGYKRKSLGISRLRFTPNPKATFNRGYTEYNIDGRRALWQSGEATRSIGEEIGVVTSCRTATGSRGGGLVQFSYKTLPGFSGTPISNGDGLSFIRPDGSTLGERANSCAVGGAGEVTGIVTLNHSLSGACSCGSAATFLPAGTRILRNYNITFERQLSAPGFAVRLIPVNLKLQLRQKSITIYPFMPSKDIDFQPYTFDIEGIVAKNPSLAQSTIIGQLEKSAAPFAFKVIDIQRDSDVEYLYKVAALNEIRRYLSARLLAELSKLSNSQLATASCPDAYINEMSISWPGGDIPLMQTKYCLRYELGICPKNHSNNHLNNGYLSDNKAVTPTRISLPTSSQFYLRNGRNRLALAFDCQNCQMLIKPTAF